MSETTSEPEVADLGAIPGTEGSGEAIVLTEIPRTEITPENLATLSLHYIDGVATLVVSGGTAVPEVLPVVDGTGSVVATYTADRTVTATTRAAIKLNYGDESEFAPPLSTHLTLYSATIDTNV
ncbi:hypothetical protein ACIA8C_26805 [Nocardia sp. NPDC051321]|uniref:hypothetical protein n=1 Tax=Nocardia sp. NPDC051321 TaxID=3364323 RepID=UPI00378EF811